MMVLVISILASSWIVAFSLMVPLHQGVYGLNQVALDSVGKFFFVGNVVSMTTGSQYSFDLFHGLWNLNIVNSGICTGSGC
jgi:hypothetical protein